MRPVWWKKYLSYLKEFHIEDAPSEYNPALHLCLINGRYQLCTENAIYSFGDLYDNFSEAFQQIDLDSYAIKEVLILGFGLGSIPIILEKKKYDFNYTAVEVDEQVIYLASKYELPYLKSSIELIQADAEIFVQTCTRQFDMIAIDIFLDDVIPSRFTKMAFLEQSNTLLRQNPSGLLLYNCLAYTEKDRQRSTEFYNTIFKKVFPEGRCIKTKGNFILSNR